MPHSGNILSIISEGSVAGKKFLAVLIDPDKFSRDKHDSLLDACASGHADFIFAGGSLLTHPDRYHATINYIKRTTGLPVVLFPGSPLQISPEADAILLLSLISGRNAEMLIGHHVTAAPYLKASGLEVISTGYMLVEGGNQTTASYMSGSLPLPGNKPEIAAVTAMAGEMLGQKLIYLDSGSGASRPVPAQMIKAVSDAVNIPVITGGGIISPADCRQAFSAGASVVVIGSALERAPERIAEFGLSRLPAHVDQHGHDQ